MGPLQANISPDVGAALICEAVERGISFFGTAELYGVYEYLSRVLHRVPREAIVISSRCYQYTYEGMRESLERALRDIGVDYIDIFGLHEQESRLTLNGHVDAIRYL